MSSEERSIFRQILPSILASLCVALVMGFVTFVGTLSRMNTMFDVMERRVGILESDAKADQHARQELQVNLAKSQVALENLTEAVKSLRHDIKSIGGK